MKKHLILMMLAIFSLPVTASDNLETAKHFLTALEKQDLDTVTELVHGDIVFEDPTFGVERRGKERVLETYRNYTGGIRQLTKYLLYGYESNDVVVLRYVFHAYVDVLRSGAEDGFAPIMGEGLRILRFKGGKIIRHTDLSDYVRVQRDIDAAAKQMAQ